jgi:hypothetical protein
MPVCTGMTAYGLSTFGSLNALLTAGLGFRSQAPESMVTRFTTVGENLKEAQGPLP